MHEAKTYLLFSNTSLHWKTWRQEYCAVNGVTCNTLPHLEAALHGTHLHGEFASHPSPHPHKTTGKDKNNPTLIGVTLILCSKSKCNQPRTVGGVAWQTHTHKHQTVNYREDDLISTITRVVMIVQWLCLHSSTSCGRARRNWKERTGSVSLYHFTSVKFPCVQYGSKPSFSKIGENIPFQNLITKAKTWSFTTVLMDDSCGMLTDCKQMMWCILRAHIRTISSIYQTVKV